MLQQNDGGLLGIKYRSHAGYDKVRCVQICVYRVIVFRLVFVRRETHMFCPCRWGVGWSRWCRRRWPERCTPCHSTDWGSAGCSHHPLQTSLEPDLTLRTERDKSWKQSEQPYWKKCEKIKLFKGLVFDTFLAFFPGSTLIMLVKL